MSVRAASSRGSPLPVGLKGDSPRPTVPPFLRTRTVLTDALHHVQANSRSL